jgi:hypothetical protein
MVQNSIVNTFDNDQRNPKLTTKTESNLLLIFTCSSPRCKLQLLYLAQHELLRENMRTRHANVEDAEIRVFFLKLLSAEISPKSDLWALFDHVPYISMT